MSYTYFEHYDQVEIVYYLYNQEPLMPTFYQTKCRIVRSLEEKK